MNFRMPVSIASVSDASIEFPPHHAAEGSLYLGSGRRAFLCAVISNLDEPVNDLFVFQADQDADFLDRFERGIEPEKAADEKISDETIEIFGERQDFFQPLAQGVFALVRQKLFRRNWS